MKRLLLLGFVLNTSMAFANQCDCQKIVGQCKGAIEFVKEYGTKPNFGAEIIVHSSEKSCSKVEYYVDSSPYQTLLVNTREVTESLFGTSPISKKSVLYERCVVCANAGKTTQSSSATSEKNSQFQGTWVGGGRNSFGFKQEHRLVIQASGSKASLSTTASGWGWSNSSQTDDGVIQGQLLKFSWPLDNGTGRNDCDFTLRSETKGTYECHSQGGMSAEMQKE
jgi:hypothetical protein